MTPGVSASPAASVWSDGWLFHGSEVLVGEDTLSCTFSVVVGADWVTRRVEAGARLGGGGEPVASSRRSTVAGPWTAPTGRISTAASTSTSPRPR